MKRKAGPRKRNARAVNVARTMSWALRRKPTVNREERRLKAKIAKLEATLTRAKAERHFMIETISYLKRQVAPPVIHPRGQDLRMIPKRKLNSGRWYLGIGRGSNVALWSGKDFLFVSEAENGLDLKRADHWDDGPPFGCFQPFEEIAQHKYGRECRYVMDDTSRARSRGPGYITVKRKRYAGCLEEPKRKDRV